MNSFDDSSTEKWSSQKMSKQSDEQYFFFSFVCLQNCALWVLPRLYQAGRHAWLSCRYNFHTFFFFYNITKSSSKISININKGMLITKQVICSLVAPIDHVYGSLGIVKASSTQKYADISKVRPEIEGSGSFTFFAPSNEAWELLDEVI